MNAKQFRAVSVTVLVPKGQEDGAANDLNNFSSAVGLHSFGTKSRPLTRAEWKEVQDNVSESILGESEEIAAEHTFGPEKLVEIPFTQAVPDVSWYRHSSWPEGLYKRFRHVHTMCQDTLGHKFYNSK